MIIAKMNQLEDGAMCEALCRASQAGVPVVLHIRGFSCLRPGVPGVTDNVRVISVIGRFLEHSRVFYFANGADDRSIQVQFSCGYPPNRRQGNDVHKVFAPGEMLLPVHSSRIEEWNNLSTQAVKRIRLGVFAIVASLA